MAKFVKGDIVVVLFTFSDLTQSKRRPALAIASLEGDVEIVNALRAQFSWTHIRIFLSIKDELKRKKLLNRIYNG